MVLFQSLLRISLRFTLFTRLIMIHVRQKEILFHSDFSLYLGVPCLFALMVNKKTSTYRQMFSELKYLAAERGKVFSPKTIVTDFESGIIPVVKTEVRVYYLYRNFFFI